MTITREDFMGTTQAKSNQINADDLLGSPLVCQITAIEMTGAADQPISIHVDAHPQPWKPSKTSRRVLAACWADAEPSEWVGRYVVLCNDPSVKWAGEAVGGIRTSHLSHIDDRKTIMVNATRGKKAAQIVEPYYAETQQAPQQPVFWPEEAFEKQFKNAEPKLISGEKVADDIIAALEKKAPLTEGQKARIRRCKAEEPEPLLDEPPQMEDDGDVFGMNDPE
jgi:hypothetical protein